MSPSPAPPHGSSVFAVNIVCFLPVPSWRVESNSEGKAAELLCSQLPGMATSGTRVGCLVQGNNDGFGSLPVLSPNAGRASCFPRSLALFSLRFLQSWSQQLNTC